MPNVTIGWRAAKMPTPQKLKKIIEIVKDACAGAVVLVNGSTAFSPKASGIISLILGAIVLACRLAETYTGTNPTTP